ncbi:MAG TPA: twin-arginine translocase subunit TatC [Actinomycetota bacterium]|nr:twin-arginine translocase subunit TatC [Actinomycetota bacterium]
MTVIEHLAELRTRLIISAAAFLGISVIAFFLFTPMLDILRQPLCDIDPERLGPQGCDLFYTGATGGLSVRLKMTALAGLIFSSPVWLYQVYAFVAPGLTSKERRYAVPFVLTSIVLFLTGLTFAYLTLPAGLNFLIKIAGPDLVPLFRAEEYFSFVGLIFLGFGMVFELPLLLFFLGLVGAVSVEQLRKGRRIAIVTIVALAAVVTPSQDPYTMLAMAVPLYGLYELTIVLLALVNRRRRKAEARN